MPSQAPPDRRYPAWLEPALPGFGGPPVFPFLCRGRILIAVGVSVFEHRDADSAFASDLNRSLIAGVCVTDDAHSRIGGEDAFQLLGREVCTIGDYHHSGMLRVADSGAPAMVDAHPTCPGSGVDQGVEERPVGDSVGTVAHGLGLAVGRGHGTRVRVVAGD